MKRFLHRLILLGCAVCVAASMSADIEWLSTDYNFGVFKEIAGARSGALSFVNKGKEPTAITNVRTTCGCTVAEFTEGEIAPGDTATVSFTYNPVGRPGRFDKTIRVYIGESNDLHILHIRGVVIGAPSTLDSQYPVEAGPLRLNRRIIPFGNVKYGTARHEFVRGYNQSTDTIYPICKNIPESVSMKMSDEAVAPGDLFSISFYFNSRDEDTLGPLSHNIMLLADAENPKDSVELLLNVNLVPDTRNLTPQQVADGPRIETDSSIVSLGKVSSGKQKFKFSVSNTGRSEMKINRIYSRQPGVYIEKYPVTIAPGKKAEVKGTLDVAQIDSSVFSVKVEILTDDPLHPVTVVRLSGEKKQ